MTVTSITNYIITQHHNGQYTQYSDTHWSGMLFLYTAIMWNNSMQYQTNLIVGLILNITEESSIAMYALDTQTDKQTHTMHFQQAAVLIMTNIHPHND